MGFRDLWNKSCRRSVTLAQEIATTKPTALLSSFAPARTYIGEQFCQAFLTVGWMTGNVGIPGGMVAENGHATAGNQGQSLDFSGSYRSYPTTQPDKRRDRGSFLCVMTPDQGSLGIVWDDVSAQVVNGHFTDGPRGQ